MADKQNGRDDAPQQIDPDRAPDHQEDGTVHLPGLVADEFGISQSQARVEIMMGSIEVDGKPWEGDKLDMPVESIAGKEIAIVGETRHFRMTYRGA